MASARSKARKRALDVLYAAEMRNRSPVEELEQLAAAGPLNDYTGELVRGVDEHRARLDEVIAGYAHGWTLERMPAVDRNVLRVAVFEILHVEDVPPPVSISEAVALVADLSTDESPVFVNGLLANVLRDRDRLVG